MDTGDYYMHIIIKITTTTTIVIMVITIGVGDLHVFLALLVKVLIQEQRRGHAIHPNATAKEITL